MRGPRIAWTGFSLALLAPAIVSAQHGISVGAKAGLSHASISGADNQFGLSARERFTGGAFVTLSLSKAFSLQSEVLLTQKGGEIYSYGYRYSTRYRTDYVELPLVGRYTVSTSQARRPGTATLVFSAGAAVAFKAASDGRAFFDMQGMGLAVIPLKTSTIDFGLVAGAGVDVSVGDGRGLVLDLRYTSGRRPVDPDVAFGHIKNAVISFTIGYSRRVG